MPGGGIIVVPLQTKGHIFPAIELCRRLADRGYTITLLLRSGASSAGPLHPLIRILDCPAPHPPDAACRPPVPGFDFEAGCISPFRQLLARRTEDLVCAVVDVMMSQFITVCQEFGVPAVSFFTSSACSAALDRAASKISSSFSDEDLGPAGRTLPLTIPGLPEDMALTISDLKHRGGPPPPGFGPGQHQHGGPPRLPPFGPGPGPAPAPPPFRLGTFGPEHSSAAPPTEPGPFRDGAPPPGPPEGLAQTVGAIALLFNTCDDLESPFIDYVAKEAGKPVWGVGPLLPASFWSGSLVRDEVARDRDSSVSEKEVLEWLDSQPRGSVIYVSFGSLVGPSDAELAELAAGLEESGRPFIWALQPGAMPHDPSGRIIPGAGAGAGYFPVELARVGVAEGEEGRRRRGLLIRGWAPQLLILSHPSTGGFLTHCGWNSTVEAIGCGVPMLTWPVHGDQMHNAKLVTRRLKIGHRIHGDGDGDGDGGREGGVKKEDVVQGIERLMSDKETRERAASMRSTFADRFPQTSSASLDAFLQFLNKSSH